MKARAHSRALCVGGLLTSAQLTTKRDLCSSLGDFLLVDTAEPCDDQYSQAERAVVCVRPRNRKGEVFGPFGPQIIPILTPNSTWLSCSTPPHGLFGPGTGGRTHSRPNIPRLL